MKINNRRYIGCKTKLLDEIYETVIENGFNSGSSFADIFAGTGVVGGYFARKGFKVTFNDTLFSNCVAYNAFFGKEKINACLINDTLAYLNSIDPEKIPNNYFSDTYGKKYFSYNDSKKIGYIRDYIEDNKNKFNKREYDYLLTSLMYSCDKIANTVGHYESYLKKEPTTKGVRLELLELENIQFPINIFNEDANELANNINCDVVYLDPPYNARQYINFYHVLENLVRWNKPTEFEGNSMKFRRNELKSNYCRKKAPFLFRELINSLKCKLIVVSYNNTYKAGSISSVNTISEKEIIEILSEKGKVSVKEIDYKAFNSGKTNLKNHKEFLYICEVK
ncbi:MAG: DNA adenine methylase [Candidatus Onthovivens sp.]|nr:DNA adenine methylase [Candidatus Onthovivens sp.]